jgi:hypothetical protein
VKIIAKLLTCLLLLLVAGMPVVACMQPDTTLTAEEMACCKQMANDCGDMGGDTSGHDCCKKAEVRIDAALVQAHFTVVHLSTISIADHQPTVSVQSDDLMSQRASHLHGHSPPESPPGSIQILRV